jgi:hypothetical protein
MPRKIQDFAQQSLIRPILVNVGRAGAANLDVLQVVEYVKQEAKMVYLLECLQKTPPPVIIFSENKNEVDGKVPSLSYFRKLIFYPDIQEYLLLKGVEAVAIHGSKSRYYVSMWPFSTPNLTAKQPKKSVSMLSNPSSPERKMLWLHLVLHRKASTLTTSNMSLFSPCRKKSRTMSIKSAAQEGVERPELLRHSST